MDTDKKTAREQIKIDTLSFEQAVAELESIVESMENGQLKLEESVQVYRLGAELLKHCRAQLVEAEKRIQVFEDGMLIDFDESERDVRE